MQSKVLEVCKEKVKEYAVFLHRLDQALFANTAIIDIDQSYIYSTRKDESDSDDDDEEPKPDGLSEANTNHALRRKGT